MSLCLRVRMLSIDDCSVRVGTPTMPTAVVHDSTLATSTASIPHLGCSTPAQWPAQAFSVPYGGLPVGHGICAGVSWRPAGATLVWLHHALASLDADLRARHGPGAGVVFRSGPYAAALIAVAETADAGVIHMTRRYEPAMQARSLRVHVTQSLSSPTSH